MKKIIATLILTQFLSDTFGQDTFPKTRQTTKEVANSARKYKMSKSERDIAIRNNLIGSWNFHNGIWQFEEDGKYKFFYRDTVRTSGTWRVKNGIIRTFKDWPKDRQYHSEEQVVYSSFDTLKFRRIGSVSPDRILTIYKIKY